MRFSDDRFAGGSSFARKRLHHTADYDDLLLLQADDEESDTRSFLHSPELKYLDLSKGGETGLVSGATVPDGAALNNWIFNPTFGICSVPNRGDGPQEYQGKAIVIKSWNVRGSFYLNPTLNCPEGFQPRWVFIALVLDTQTNGTQCTSDQILQFVYQANNTGFCSPLQNMEFSRRFRILRRATWDLSPSTLSIDIGIAPDPNSWQCAGRCIPFSFYVPLDLVVNFKRPPVDNDIGAVVDNSLHVVCGQSRVPPLLSTNQPTITAGYVSRIRFLSPQ